MLEAYKKDSGITEVFERAGLPVDQWIGAGGIADLLLRYGPLVELREGRGEVQDSSQGRFEWLDIYGRLEEALPPVRTLAGATGRVPGRTLTDTDH